jgi:ribosomal-protein-alanine N-acetyltransferase
VGVLRVRELGHSNIHNIVNYWTHPEEDFMKGMGVDISKIPKSKKLIATLTQQLELPIENRDSYCLIWYEDNVPIGHCNTNPSEYGKEGFMHLHIWEPEKRKKGLGTELVRMSLPYFFKELRLKTLYSEPYAENPAPSKALEKLGFEFVKEYKTTPGSLSFEQNVKQWRLTAERFNSLYI